MAGSTPGIATRGRPRGNALSLFAARRTHLAVESLVASVAALAFLRPAALAARLVGCGGYGPGGRCALTALSGHRQYLGSAGRALRDEPVGDRARQVERDRRAQRHGRQ